MTDGAQLPVLLYSGLEFVFQSESTQFHCLFMQTWEELVRVWENLGYEFVQNTTVGFFATRKRGVEHQD